MPVKCGKGHYHDSVADVRECYNVSVTFPITNTHRPNKYPDVCIKCGWLVPAETGRVDKVEDKWVVTHLEGECKPKSEKIVVGATGMARYEAIPAGHYATKSLTGNNDFDFWRVDIPAEGPHKGKQFVKRIVGGKPEWGTTRNIKFKVMDAILAEGIDICAKRYADELGRCSRCNRTLTDETSRMYGMGPECRSK